MNYKLYNVPTKTTLKIRLWSGYIPIGYLATVVISFMYTRYYTNEEIVMLCTHNNSAALWHKSAIVVISWVSITSRGFLMTKYTTVQQYMPVYVYITTYQLYYYTLRDSSQ